MYAVSQAVEGALGLRLRTRGDTVKTRARVQIRLDLVERDGGTELAELANQVDQNPPTPLSSAQRDEVASRVAGTRSTITGYYVLGALFGVSCRGGTAFSLVREAIGERLRVLGVASSTEMLDALCIRMPAPLA
jgi:hypothetical protein